jgi:hypothetical protein
MGRCASAAVLLLLACAFSRPAFAQEAEPPADVARRLFVEGAALVREAKWSEALAAFERSHEIVLHPVTVFNIGACERALGNLARARRTFERARALDQQPGASKLPASARTDIEAFLQEIASILVTVDVRLDPANAAIAVDGRPLQKTVDGDRPTFTAGLAAPGPGEALEVSSFRLELDPGTHVIVLSRPGFQDIVRRQTFKRGEPGRLELLLARLDGTINVRAGHSVAAVSVDGVDVGTAPITVKRPAGRYRVIVRKAGYVTFETEAVLEPGGRVDLSAPLPTEPQPITKTWWFWTAAGAVVLVATATTYFLTRPDPERPAANGGGLGWVLRAP